MEVELEIEVMKTIMRMVECAVVGARGSDVSCMNWNRGDDENLKHKVAVEVNRVNFGMDEEGRWIA